MPTVSAGSESGHLFKNSAGGVLAMYAVNLSSVAGFLVLIDASSIPADGSITPLAVAPIQPNDIAVIEAFVTPIATSSGIVAVLTSAASPFTKTTSGGLTGFLSCQFR
jgi:hypothetical protein